MEKYAIIKDDVSITTCKHEALKEEWQWVGTKKVLGIFFIENQNQNKVSAVITKIHDGYLNAKDGAKYIKSINGKIFTGPGREKKKI